MVYTLLLVTVAISTVVCWLTTRLFSRPANAILQRIIQDEIYSSWSTYLRFALFVVGISSGVQIWQLERYITPSAARPDASVPPLTTERWIPEVFRTIIETLQGIAWVLLVFFMVALLAFVFVRVVEIWRAARTSSNPAAKT